jgi:glycosyltransferase involved in cell wall biosynthesis
MVYNLAPIVVSRLIRCPLIIEINGPLLDEMRMIGAGRVELGLIRLSQKLSFRSADRLVVVAEGLGDRIRELYSLSPEKIMVIPNGTDPDRVKPVDMEESQRSIGLTPGPVVGFLGSCYPYHDIDTLINAAPAIISRNPEVRFLIVGDGYMRPAWMARVEKEGLAGYFVFTGAVPFEEVPRHVSAFTVCIALFASESGEKMNRSPMKLYDYMACARPTVATDLPGNGDVIRTWKAGLAIPPGDASALAEAVNRLLGDSALCAEMGKNGRNAVEEYFSWQRVVADIVRTVEMIRDQKR